jgi:CxxC-x17-CxxC domain-containing protein
MFQDKVLVCKDCGNEFSFTAGEQELFAARGFTNEPGRCSQCRAVRKERNPGRGDSGRGDPGRGIQRRVEREMHPAVCHTCGTSTTVPFKPTGDKPVYCRNCYKPQRKQY